MQASPSYTHQHDVSFDGGDLDCGNGLLLLIRKHIDPLPRGGLLKIRSSEISAEEDLRALRTVSSQLSAGTSHRFTAAGR